MLLHFTKYHNVDDMVIKPIEFHDDIEKLREREKYWIRELNTVFPYGLNDRIDFDGIRDAYTHVLSNSPKTIYSVFNKVKNNRTKKGSGMNRRNRADNWNVEEFFHELLDIDTFPVCREVKCRIMRLSNDQTMDLLTHVSHHLTSISTTVNGCNEFILYVIKDIAVHKLSRHHPSPVKKTANSYLVVDYVNGLLDDINLPSLINNKEIMDKFPHDSEFCTPSLSFKYSRTTRSRITNYKKAVQEDVSSTRCNCANYPPEYVDNHHQHVFTGDINIVEDKNVKTLFSKGLNYREPQKPDKAKVKSACQAAIDRYINTVSPRVNMNTSAFTPWKVELLKAIDSKLSTVQLYNYNSELGNSASRNYLDKLHKDFVIAPIDKASNNISIVCKSYYHQVLNNEILQSGNFEQVQESEIDVVDRLDQFLKSKGIQVDESSQKLPFLYFTPKMHKDPPGSRFITAGKDTITSPLSKLLSSGLKSMLKTQKNFSAYLNKYKVYNDYFIIDNHDEVLNFMNKSNVNGNGRKSVRSFDFKTLYTKIPHIQLKQNVQTFVNRIFKHKNKRYIVVTDKSAYFSNKRCSKHLSLTADEFLCLVDFIVDNSYVVYQGQVYRQIIGIPMGTNCAPDLANIYLHVFEYDYIHSLIDNQNYDLAAKLSNLFRYQDDLIVFEDDRMFETIIRDMYPPVMELENTNLSPCKVNYLDMTISVHRGKYFYKSFDKRNDFGFEIINYPDLRGNIPKRPAYGVFISQLVRFCSINRSVHHYKRDIEILVKKLLLKGFSKVRLCAKFRQYCLKYLQVWSKFGINIIQDFQKLFQ